MALGPVAIMYTVMQGSVQKILDVAGVLVRVVHVFTDGSGLLMKSELICCIQLYQSEV